MNVFQKIITKANVGLKIIFAVLLLTIGGCEKSDSERQNVTNKNVSLVQKIPYKIARQWTIPNGGYGKEIVIDPKYRNDSGLKALGEQIRQETINDRNAFVLIFDDLQAAGLHLDAISDKLSKKDLKFHDDHMLGNYSRNINTGYDQLQYNLKGFMNDPLVTIKY